MRILVTGGAGFIGALAVWRLLDLGHDVCVVDNLSVGHQAAVDRAAHLAGKSVEFYPCDVRQTGQMIEIMQSFHPEAVMHFAGLKSVAESVSSPERYYENNVQGSLSLIQAMQQCQVHRLVFSSSATVYGASGTPPFSEQAELGPVNPYGRSKWMVELMMRDVCAAHTDFTGVILRYFNPVGAHPSGQIGEWVQGSPNNLVPYVMGVLQGRFDRVRVFGSDYPTPDGSGVRDYIHVLDLIEGHVAALGLPAGLSVFNLGTGRGYSVHEVIQTMQSVSGRTIPFDVVDRRPGDVAISIADPGCAERLLCWKAQRDLTEMCRDVWNFAKCSPRGYE